jgi:hypothetical protein
MRGEKSRGVRATQWGKDGNEECKGEGVDQKRRRRKKKKEKVRNKRKENVLLLPCALSVADDLRKGSNGK